MNHLFRVPAMRVEPQAELALPGSKSHANRAIVCAVLAEGKTLIKNATPCDDVSVMVANLQKMGFRIEWSNPHRGELLIHGGLPKNKGKATLDCHNAGTALRFLTSVAALTPGTWTLTGNEHMLKRPIHDLTSALRALGAKIEDQHGLLPIVVHGGTLTGSDVSLKADISSQYLTSLMLISPRLPRGLTVTLTGPLASAKYVDLTAKVMRDFGSSISVDMPSFTVAGKIYTARQEYEVEGDWSAAGAWLVLEALTGGSIKLTNISRASEQSDRLLPGIIDSMHAKGDITVDCTDVPDQLMNLAVLAAFRTGKTHFTGARNLRHKECDRLHVITIELRKAGVAISEHDDGVTVVGSGPAERWHSHKPVILDPHDDHRMAMAFAVLGLLKGHVTIKNPACTDKSYPFFFQHLEHVLHSCRPVAVIGMRGAGKSGLARRLASKLKLKVVDSDKRVVERIGPIKAFVAAKGWPAFRHEEESVIRHALQTPGIVLACGGGATETPGVREALKKDAIVLWLQAHESALVERLKSGKRPSLTQLPIHEEVKKLVSERTPNYRETATLEIPPHLPFPRQVVSAIASLTKRLRSFDLHSRSRIS